MAMISIRANEVTTTGVRTNVVAMGLLAAPVATVALWSGLTSHPWRLVAAVLLGLVLMQAPRVARQWERAVILRLGKFVGLRGPGLFWVVPFVDSVSSWIDQRVILGQAEVEIAKSFETASLSYVNNPTALHLRAMNMLYEGLKEKGAMMLIPSSAVESMGMGGLMGAAALMQKTLTTSGEEKK